MVLLPLCSQKLHADASPAPGYTLAGRYHMGRRSLYFVFPVPAPGIATKKTDIISGFEKRYEIIGLPSLLLLVITGIAMAYRYGIFINTWFSFSHSIEKVVSFKLLLLLVTVLLALHARLFIIPRLRVATLWLLAVHIILVTVIGITMLVLGSFVRFGGL